MTLVHFFPVLEQIPTTNHISTERTHRNKNDLTLKLRAQSHCFCNQKSKELQKASSVQVGVTQCTNFHGNFFCTRWASHRAQASIKLDHERCQSFLQCLKSLNKLYGLPNFSSNVASTHPMHSQIRHVKYLPEQSSRTTVDPSL